MDMISCVSVGIACVSVCGAIGIYLHSQKKEEEQQKLLDKLSNEAQNLLDKKNFYKEEVKQLKHQIEVMEEKEEKKLPSKQVFEEKEYVYKKKFTGKVIVGNYHDFFLKEARTMLRSFGLSVDCVTTGDAIYERIKNGEKYDMILTNNTYQDGMNGGELVYQLHELENFNTPIVVQTIEHGSRERFMRMYEYDEYIEKPLNPEKMEKILDKFFNKKKAKKD